MKNTKNPNTLLVFSVASSLALYANAQSQTLDNVLTEKTGIQMDSLGVATGLYFIYEAYTNLKAPAKDVGGGLTSAALGLSTALGSIVFVRRTNAAAADPLKAFQGTKEYQFLAEKIGENHARQLLLDIDAGWEMDRLAQKYPALANHEFDLSVYRSQVYNGKIAPSMLIIQDQPTR